jgi:hypothetical protein
VKLRDLTFLTTTATNRECIHPYHPLPFDTRR